MQFKSCSPNLYVFPEQGPVSLTIFVRNLNSMETSPAIPLLAIRSQILFAHAKTAQLSCHVQNFVATTDGIIIKVGVKRNFHWIWITMKKKRLWNFDALLSHYMLHSDMYVWHQWTQLLLLMLSKNVNCHALSTYQDLSPRQRTICIC